jgi:hypothetical protein
VKIYGKGYTIEAVQKLIDYALKPECSPTFVGARKRSEDFAEKCSATMLPSSVEKVH